MAGSTVTFEKCSVERETPKALLVACEEWDKPRWIPKSQIDDDSEVFERDTDGDLIVSEWWAQKEGLI